MYYIVRMEAGYIIEILALEYSHICYEKPLKFENNILSTVSCSVM